MQIIREPSVFLIQEPRVIDENVFKWLKHIGASDEAASKFAYHNFDTDDVSRITELASRSCYRSFEVGLNSNVTRVRGSTSEHLMNVIKSKHGSVFAHGMITFAIEDVSRVFSHELVRHSVGTGISQLSGRYVRVDDLKVVIPIDKDYDPVNLEDDLVNEVLSNLESSVKAYQDAKFADPKFESFSAKKKLTSLIRRLLPNGMTTGIVFSGCIRAWRNMIEQRTAPDVEMEYRIVMDKIATILVDRYPDCFQDYRVGPSTGEGAPTVLLTEHRKI